MNYYQTDSGDTVTDPGKVASMYQQDRGISGFPWAAILIAGGVFWLFVYGMKGKRA